MTDPYQESCFDSLGYSWDDFFHGFRSLLELYQFAAREYTECCFRLEEIYGLAFWLDNDSPEEKDGKVQNIRAQLSDLARITKRMGIDCAEAADRIAAKINKESTA